MSMLMRELLKDKLPVPRCEYQDDLSTDVDCGLRCEDESLTKQSEAAACDINNIVRHWIKSGGAMDLSQRVGQFLDVAEVPDFQTCQQFIASASDLFMSLPATVRDRFKNDPGEFLAFVQDPKNVDEMVEMGLATKKAPVEPAGLPESPLAGATGTGAQATAAASAAGSTAP